MDPNEPPKTLITLMTGIRPSTPSKTSVSLHSDLEIAVAYPQGFTIVALVGPAAPEIVKRWQMACPRLAEGE